MMKASRLQLRRVFLRELSTYMFYAYKLTTDIYSVVIVPVLPRHKSLIWPTSSTAVKSRTSTWSI